MNVPSFLRSGFVAVFSQSLTSATTVEGILIGGQGARLACENPCEVEDYV